MGISGLCFGLKDKRSFELYLWALKMLSESKRDLGENVTSRKTWNKRETPTFYIHNGKLQPCMYSVIDRGGQGEDVKGGVSLIDPYIYLKRLIPRGCRLFVFIALFFPFVLSFCSFLLFCLFFLKAQWLVSFRYRRQKEHEISCKVKLRSTINGTSTAQSTIPESACL